jgi:predicted dehydrogenase
MKMPTYRAALIGCSRMGAFIDNESSDGFLSPHAGGYAKCERTELIACCDVRAEARDRAGERWGVTSAHRYADYRDMIAREKPDIVSVATQPEQRAEIVVFACEHGVRGVYAEKAMAASLAEADRMVAAVDAAGVMFNLGTNRRWSPGFDAMLQVVADGRLGKLRSLVAHSTGALFNTASHALDLMLRLNGDRPVHFVQGHLSGEVVLDGDLLRNDPTGHGNLEFADGVVAYMLNSGRGNEVEAICENGVLTSLLNGQDWRLREAGGVDGRGRKQLREGTFPPFTPADSTVELVRDLAEALDGSHPPRGGVHIARAQTELIFALVESHMRGGARVELPLAGSRYRLARGVEARQPRYEPPTGGPGPERRAKQPAAQTWKT